MKITEIIKTKKNNILILFENNEKILLSDLIFVKYNNILKVGNILSKQILQTILNDNYLEYGKKKAFDLISRKYYSEKELTAKLSKEKIPDEIIQKILNRLKELGYVNDAKYLTIWANDKINTNLWGPMMLKMKLQQKTKDKELIEQIIKQVYANNRQHEIIERIIKKKKYKNLKVDKNKIMKYLYSKGFSYSEILNYFNEIENEI